MDGEEGSGDRILAAEGVVAVYQQKKVSSAVRGLKRGFWQIFGICRENQNVSEGQSENDSNP